MADTKQAAGASFDEMIKAGRKKKEAERLAQEILGKRRSSTPANSTKKSNLGGSLASRVGVTKRPASLSRSQSSQSRVQQSRAERNAPPPRQPSQTTASARPIRNNNSNQNKQFNSTPQTAPTQSNGNGLSIKGAAGGPYVVEAGNFAEGTSAADIRSVMQDVGGDVLSCRLLSSRGTVAAEISFKERAAADAVISTFNNKKADGQLLYVRFKNATTQTSSDQNLQDATVESEYQDPAMDDAMEVDENARSMEAENRLREERRGGNSNQGRPDAFPSGPRNMRAFEQDDSYYYNNNGSRGPAQQQASYQDGRYGFGAGGYGRGGSGRYQDDRRGYGGRAGQWR